MDLDSSNAPLPVKQAARRLLAACREFDRAAPGTLMKLFQEAAVVEAHISGKACSWKKVQKKYRDWVNAGRDDWALLDKRFVFSNSHKVRTNNPEFKTFLYQLVVRNNRSTEQALYDLREIWAAHGLIGTIPGYEDWPGWPDVPAGWSIRNLFRKVPKKQELTIIRQGRRAAYADLAQVLATRAGCYPAQFVLWDDVWLDRYVLCDGEINRPLQLGCLDLLTGKRLVWGTKFRGERKDGTKFGLTGDEMRMLVVTFLVTVGYSPRGTVMVVENGTAAIDKEFEVYLYTMTNGAVTVNRSGMTGRQQVLLDGFGGRGVGNPRHKSPLESWHNLFHNVMASCDAPSGKDYAHLPEWVWGMIKEQKKLELAKPRMTPEQRALLMNVIPTFADLVDELPGVVARINRRTDHELEGWEECGFMQNEYRLDLAGDQWGRVSDLDPASLALLQGLTATRKGYLRMRRMSPAEAWDACMERPENRLVKLTPSQACELMGVHMARPLRRRGGFFHVKDRSVFDGELIYETRVCRQYGGNEYVEELPPSAQVRGIINPWDNSRLYLVDERDRCVGYAQRCNRVSWSDREGVRAAMGYAKARNAELMEPVRQRLAQAESDVDARRRHNKAVIGGSYRTQLERLEDGEARRAERRVSARQEGGGRMAVPPAMLSPDYDLPESNFS